MQTELAHTSPESFQKITLTFEEYILAKEGDDEIEWNGSMYDIATLTFQDGNVEILALRDSSETDIWGFLSKLIQTASNDSKAPPSALMQYLSLIFTLPEINEIRSLAILTVIKHHTIYQKQKTEYCTEICSPPPQAYVALSVS